MNLYPLTSLINMMWLIFIKLILINQSNWMILESRSWDLVDESNHLDVGCNWSQRSGSVSASLGRTKVIDKSLSTAHRDAAIHVPRFLRWSDFSNLDLRWCSQGWFVSSTVLRYSMYGYQRLAWMEQLGYWGLCPSGLICHQVNYQLPLTIHEDCKRCKRLRWFGS